MRTISIRPNGRTIRSNASILSSVPVTSIVTERLETSTTLPRKMSANCMICARGVAVGGDLEQRELARDGLLGLEVADLDHVDQLVQLLGDLVDRVERAVDRERDARDRRVVGRPDRQRVDVEPAPGEQAGDPGEHARLVLHQDREDVLAAGVDAAGGLEVLEVEDLLGAWLTHRSAHHVPRGLAGGDHRVAVLLLGHVHVDQHDGPSVSSAVFMPSTSSSLSVTRMPVAPNASASLTQSGLAPISTDE